ncbi:MAG: hypothetical protein HY961_05035 [Ignavibacteriae bacterium]|nr:hypothetical protein [Ignavibacteriota bacterium]
MRFVFTVLVASVAAAQPELAFRHLTIDNGLSQNSVNCIHQDRLGFMWFGTQDGLNRYDGYEFKQYHHEPGNPNSLGNNYVWTIHEDRDGIFWIGSFGGGLTRFDPATETFMVFKHEKGNPRSLSNNHVFSIVEFPESTLWLCTDDGLNKFDKRTQLVTRYFNTPDNIEGLPTNHMGAIAIQKPDYLWLETNRGLARFTIRSGATEYFTTDPTTGTIPLGYVQGLTMHDAILSIVCAAGLLECDVKNRTTSVVIDRRQIADTTLIMRGAISDRRGSLWVGTSNGLLQFDRRQRRITRHLHDPDNEKTLTHNNILSLYQSNDDVIWIGTRNGLNQLQRIKENFGALRRQEHLTNTLSHKTVGPVLEDSRGIVWLGTPDGLNAYDRVRKMFTVFKNDPRNPNTISANYILSLCEDSKGMLWVGTRGGGMNRLSFPKNDIQAVSITRFVAEGRSGLRSNTIHSIREDSAGTLWVGTAGHGLAKYNPHEGTFKHFESASDGSGPSHTYVYCILEDSFGNMWIGTPTGGLNLFDRESERFIYIHNVSENLGSLSNNIVLTLVEDSAHALWVGTAGGLNKLILPLRPNLMRFFRDSVNIDEDSLFVRYGRREGFPNDVIYGILQDDGGNLWLSTNRGLIVFNEDSSKHVLRIFDVSDGLQNNEFNQNGYFRNAAGEMYFAGIDGVNIFHPDSIRGNAFVPPVVFTDFLLFNKSVLLGPRRDEHTFTLEKAIHSTETLKLSHDHDVLSFTFAALGFINPERQLYAYRLEGFDKDWISAGQKRSVTYTNLDPGEYVLRVRASNNDGVWNEEGAGIALTIPPPPWLSWYAYLFYGVSALMIVTGIIRMRVKSATRELETKGRIERARLDEREVVRKQSSADFHDEAGHRLTKIALFTELARGESGSNHKLREYLAKVEEHTKDLSSGMRDFIWVLDPTKETLLETLQRLRDFGNSMFGYTDTKFVAPLPVGDGGQLVLSMEGRRALMLIFKEAMNNCLKYSEALSVELTATVHNGTLEIILADDGKGFDVNATSDGYGLKTMKERAMRLGAALTVSSHPNKKTVVRFACDIRRLCG